MDKNQIIKYVLIAGAAYLVYRYLQQSGAFGQTPAVEAQPGAQLPVDSTQPHDMQPEPLAPLVATPIAISSDLKPKMAALLAADNSGGVAADGVTKTHNFYVYQYYYQQLTGHDLPPSESAFGLDEAGRLTLMTFDQFWALLTAANAAGHTVGYPSLGQIQKLASAWTM